MKLYHEYIYEKNLIHGQFYYHGVKKNNYIGKKKETSNLQLWPSKPLLIVTTIVKCSVFKFGGSIVALNSGAL